MLRPFPLLYSFCRLFTKVHFTNFSVCFSRVCVLKCFTALHLHMIFSMKPCPFWSENIALPDTFCKGMQIFLFDLWYSDWVTIFLKMSSNSTLWRWERDCYCTQSDFKKKNSPVLSFFLFSFSIFWLSALWSRWFYDDTKWWLTKGGFDICFWISEKSRSIYLYSFFEIGRCVCNIPVWPFTKNRTSTYTAPIPFTEVIPLTFYTRPNEIWRMTETFYIICKPSRSTMLTLKL